MSAQIYTLRIDQVRQPKDLTTTLAEFVRTPVGDAALKAVLAWIGVPEQAAAVASFPLAQANPRGEEATIHCDFQPGFKPAAVLQFRAISQVPKDGDRAPKMSALFGPGSPGHHGVGIYTWVPIRHFGEGRAWIEFEMDILAVTEDVYERMAAEGKCLPYGRNFIQGSGGQYTALPPVAGWKVS